MALQTSNSNDRPLLLMGATGRVSQMLLKHWKAVPPSGPVRSQSRGEGFDLKWSPLEDGPDPLLRFNEAEGGLGAIFAMIGATPSTAGDLSQTAALSCAVVAAAAQAGVPRIFLASSSAVYAVGEGLSESDDPAPTSAYGHAKLDMEHAVAELGAPIDVCCLRIGNVAGADALLGQAAHAPTRKTISLDRFLDSKGPLRSYIGPSHFARCLELLVEHRTRLPPVLNFAATPPVEMAELVQAAGLQWAWTAAAAERYKTQRITLDCALLETTIGSGSLATTPDSMVAELRTLGVLA